MSENNFPDEEKDVVDIIAKAGYLRASNDKVTVSLDSANTINIQPKKNIFGVKVQVENNGNIAPTLTFDTKKLRDDSYKTSPKEILDTALEEFWENNDV